eukprot:UN23281
MQSNSNVFSKVIFAANKHKITLNIVKVQISNYCFDCAFILMNTYNDLKFLKFFEIIFIRQF